MLEQIKNRFLKSLECKWIIVAILVLLMLLQTIFFVFNIPVFVGKKLPIKVGLLHSSTGYRAFRETPVREATLMARHMRALGFQA